ncbi:unnamed protein product [Lymnaea stagnalis]|uniref:Methyltransferase FkbM domain-containing protein n=1 Tax=Lymnaea stagnalis TaxID=6523 RepID=A0AAV2IIJ2_LYMST
MTPEDDGGEMKLQRVLNTYLPSTIRNHRLALGLLACISIGSVLLIGHSLRYELTPMSFCQSEVNLRSDSLNQSGIHVIPSTPQKRHGAVAVGEDDVTDNECVEVFTPDKSGRMLICIHDPKRDLMVSAHLKNEGSWEPENVEAMYQAHQMFPDLALVDLGCNVGVFTLPAARMGMEVVAVDAMLKSLKLLQRSLLINGLSCHVTLIHNALHRKRQQMRLAVDPSNIGGSSVVDILEFRRDKIPKSQFVDAICLDDLVPLVAGRRVFLKIDLEGNEAAVLECAHEFFTRVDVKIVLIEWMYYRHNDEGSGKVKKFLTSYGMMPTWGVDPDRLIDLHASHSWPDNVFWMKVGAPS